MNLFEKLVKRAHLKELGNLMEDENYVFLRRHRLFSDLSPPALLMLHKRLVARRYSRHETIFAEGAPGICMFIVKTGRVEISARGGNGDDEPGHVTAVINEGELFGELSLVSTTFRTNSARALEQGTDLLALSSYDIDAVNEHHPADGLLVLRGITESIARCLLDNDRRLRQAEAMVGELEERLTRHESD